MNTQRAVSTMKMHCSRTQSHAKTPTAMLVPGLWSLRKSNLDPFASYRILTASFCIIVNGIINNSNEQQQETSTINRQSFRSIQLIALSLIDILYLPSRSEIYNKDPISLLPYLSFIRHPSISGRHSSYHHSTPCWIFPCRFNKGISAIDTDQAHIPILY